MGFKYNFQSVSINERTPMAGLAFDGQLLYSSLPYDYSLLIMDDAGLVIGRHKTRRPFCSICYDPIRQCFWAVCKESPIYIYRLDKNLEEMGRIRLSGWGHGVQTAVAVESNGGIMCISGQMLILISPSGEITSSTHLLAGTRAITSYEDLVITANQGAVFVSNNHLNLRQVKYISDKIQVNGLAVTGYTPSEIELLMLCREDCYNRIHNLNINLQQKAQALNNDNPQNNLAPQPINNPNQTKGNEFIPFPLGMDRNQGLMPPLNQPQNQNSFGSIMEQVLLDLLNIFPEE